jgi:hypothetical protein
MLLAYAQGCTVQTAKDETSVAYLTLSIDGSLDDARRAALDELAARSGGTIAWRFSAAAGRTYALLELAGTREIAAVREASGGSVYETAVIALAVSPAVPEALPALIDAFDGNGRPDGVLACRLFPGGIVIEWDPDRSPAEMIFALVDVELRRFRSGRTAELLAPLPPAVVAKVAAQGLGAPQVAPDRILEVLMAESSFERHKANRA